MVPLNSTSKSSPRRHVHTVALVLLSLVSLRVAFLQKNDAERSSSYGANNNNDKCLPGIKYWPSGFPSFRSREDIPLFLEKRKFRRGAEIGVQKGYFSKRILEQWPSCKYMALIDLWKQQENYKDIANVNDNEHEAYFQETLEVTKPWKEKVQTFRMLSTEAATKIPDSSLDFVYVDARHDYCGVSEDMRSYWPKLRPGGIMAGHDYLTNAEVRGMDWGLCMDGTREDGAVVGAVLDFAEENGLQVSVTHREPRGHTQSWILQKPTIPECVEHTANME